MSGQKLEMPYLACVPFQVLTDKDVSPQAKLYYGCLVGLSKKEGYCWASDEALAEMQEVDISTLKRWHKELEDKKHIRRETKSHPYRNEKGKMLWKKQRKIFVNNGFSNNVFEPLKNEPIDEPLKNEPYKSKSLKRKLSKGKRTSVHAAAPLPKKKKTSVYDSLPDKEKDLIEKLFVIRNARKEIKNPPGWKEMCAKGRWHREEPERQTVKKNLEEHYKIKETHPCSVKTSRVMNNRSPHAKVMNREDPYKPDYGSCNNKLSGMLGAITNNYLKSNPKTTSVQLQ